MARQTTCGVNYMLFHSNGIINSQVETPNLLLISPYTGTTF